MEEPIEGEVVSADEQVEEIVEAAGKLGVEVDSSDATQWLTTMAADQAMESDVGVDAKSGIYGHRVSLLDFDPAVLERYRKIGAVVDIPNRPGVETALSLSGSAAQSKVQLFPGDADFFERVNIVAPTRAEACTTLAAVLREAVLGHFEGEGYRFVEAKWGTFRQDVIRGGQKLKSGMYMSWTAAEALAGKMEVQTAAGEPLVLDWSYGIEQPGWCKLDWVIIESVEGRVVHASNMLDVTWERPDGDIEPLDGFLDPYYQEVYLDAESIPLFSKVVRHLTPDALNQYVDQLKHEVLKYSERDPTNFGKVAKRLYNIFRLTGHWSEALFIRELFDEPAALLYQVAALLETIEEALDSGVSGQRDALIDQVDKLIRDVIRVCEGTSEERIVDALLKLRDDLTGRRALGEARSDLISESNKLVGDLVNTYFQDRLLMMPEVRIYIESLKSA